MEAGVAPPGEAQQTATPPMVPVSFKLTPQEYDVLVQLANERSISIEQLLREALVEKKFFMDNRRNGLKITLQDSDGKLYPVGFAY